MRIHLTPSHLAIAPLVAMASLPTSAFAKDYLSVEQAQKILFPDAERFAVKPVQLDHTAMVQLEKRAGLPARSTQWTIQLPMKNGKPLGVLVMDNVVGKFELITYAVALNMDGKVRQVEVMSYRESHGGEIRLPAWRAQFVGKSSSTGLRLGQDISNISGATLSCTHITDGVRRISALVQLLGEKHGLD